MIFRVGIFMPTFLFCAKLSINIIILQLIAIKTDSKFHYFANIV